MSKSLVDLVDEWELYDEEKRLANASAKQAAGYQKQIEGEMLELMEALGVDRAAAGTRRLELRGQTVPRVEDWEALHEHIRETGAFDLLQRRMAAKNFAGRVEQGETIPGVEALQITNLHIVKR